MKNSFFFFWLAIALAAALAACNDDREDLNPNGKGSLSVGLSMPTTASGGQASSKVRYTLTGPAGEFIETFRLNSSTSTEARTLRSYHELAPGTYTVTILGPLDTIANGSQFYLNGASNLVRTIKVGADSVNTTVIKYDFFGDLYGIRGNWVSKPSSKNSQLAKTTYPYAQDVDSIRAYFNADGTYSMDTYKGGAIDSTFSGTYKQTGSSGQRTLNFYQTQPFVDTLNGVGRSFIANKDSMRFRVLYDTAAAPVQFGTVKANIQSFRRINY
jgi:hypothetical protein